GHPAGRVYLDTEPALTIGALPPLRRSLEHALAADAGETIADDTPIQQAFVRAFAEPFLYLNRWRTSDADLPLLKRRVKSHLLALEGIDSVYTAEEIRGGQAPESVKLGFRADRSGDLVVILKPGYIYDSAVLRVAAS